MVPACALGLTLAADRPCTADSSLAPPAAVTRRSPDRKHCATARPEDRFVAYEMAGTTRGATLWSVRGWESVFNLGNGGESLVVCFKSTNLLPLDYSPNQALLSFFRKGAFVRSVNLRELVPDLSKLQRTVSHFRWGQCQGFERRRETQRSIAVGFASTLRTGVL